jgi:hypothetical protein
MTDDRIQTGGRYACEELDINGGQLDSAMEVCRGSEACDRSGSRT